MNMEMILGVINKEVLIILHVINLDIIMPSKMNYSEQKIEVNIKD